MTTRARINHVATNYKISPFLMSQKHTLELEDFEPKGGYEIFLKQFCEYIDEEFLDWYQGVMEGIGHITYRSYKLEVYWTDLPFALSFDCRDKTMAEELQPKLEAFFAQS